MRTNKKISYLRKSNKYYLANKHLNGHFQNIGDEAVNVSMHKLKENDIPYNEA